MGRKFQTLEVETLKPDLMLVTLNRPKVSNAINAQMMHDLRDLWRQLCADANPVKCIVLTGKGDKAFCAGADLKERNDIDVETWQRQHAVLEEAMIAMLSCPVPIIAAINGAAFGGGLELLLASDFAYATETARFAFPETSLGIMPGAMGTQNLPQACGLRRAKEICFSGLSFSAYEALEWGIINKICKPRELIADTLAIATRICENAPLATRQVKKSLNASDRNANYAYEIEAYNYLLPTEDRKEGIRAFNEKRKPKFMGK